MIPACTPQQPGVTFVTPGLQEDVTPVDPVVFVEAPEEKELPMAAREIKEAAEKPAVKVKVVAPYRVIHEGKPYVGGDVVDVPADTADTWLKSKWAEPVSQRGKK
jgi:hypothetical protein